MNKSSGILVVLAAAGLGALIGVSMVDKDQPERLAASQSPALIAQPSGWVLPFRYLAPGDLAVELDAFDRAKPSAIGENFVARDAQWKTETVSLELPLDGAVEYKAIMNQGGSIVFDWSSNGNVVYTDFHGHDTAFGDDFFVRYEEIETTSQSGMIVAAFSGEHGWYWLNMADSPTEITLRVAGFFDEIIKVDIQTYE